MEVLKKIWCFFLLMLLKYDKKNIALFDFVL